MDIVDVGGDFTPETVLEAYRQGQFPMPLRSAGPMCWWSPDPRGVLEIEDLHVSRSLRRSMRRFEFRVDTVFAEVLDGCADPGRPSGWIDRRIRNMYLRLHYLGWAHSIETFSDDILVGGTYGLAIGGLFTAESKFHRVPDASKAAVVALVAGLAAEVGDRLVDVQWSTDHLARLGVTECSRSTYLERLPGLLATPGAAMFSAQSASVAEVSSAPGDVAESG